MGEFLSCEDWRNVSPQTMHVITTYTSFVSQSVSTLCFEPWVTRRAWKHYNYYGYRVSEWRAKQPTTHSASTSTFALDFSRNILHVSQLSDTETTQTGFVFHCMYNHTWNTFEWIGIVKKKIYIKKTAKLQLLLLSLLFHYDCIRLPRCMPLHLIHDFWWWLYAALDLI